MGKDNILNLKSGQLFVFYYLQQFNFKYKCFKGFDDIPRAPFAIGEVIGDIEHHFGTLLHELQAFHPAADDVINAELSRFSTVI